MSYPVYARIDGPVVIIGFGSIGRGTLPLIERHFELTVIGLLADFDRHSQLVGNLIGKTTGRFFQFRFRDDAVDQPKRACSICRQKVTRSILKTSC